MRKFGFAASWLSGLALFASAVAPSATLINGAGASFPYPLYAKWFSEYQKKNSEVQINYQSIGSGGGVRQFTEKTIDFGATDAPMTDEQITKTGATVLHLPTVIGAVVVTYNLPGIAKGLKLSGTVLADIYLGKIAKWNDPAIAKANPTLKLPDTAILVVHRSDGSGTSAIFTDYLSKVSADWKTKVGAGTAVKWPSGLGGKGNEGVSGLVKQTPGSIGYVELIFAETNALPYAAVQNKTGTFVTPDLKAVTAAAEGAMKNLPADYRVSLTDPEGKASYPIAGFTYLLIWKDFPDAAKGEKLAGFLKWAMKEGQGFAPALHYAPLPKALVAKVEQTIAGIRLKKATP